jgi:hypothetical protein
MFGRGWEAAVATIVSRRLVAEGHSSGGGGGTGGAHGLDGIGGGRPMYWEEFEYTADVRPDSGAAPFQATINEPRNGIHFHTPDAGQVVRVKFNADQKVKFDHSDPVVFGHGTQSTADQQADVAAEPSEFAKDAAEFRPRTEEFRHLAEASNRGGPVIISGDGKLGEDVAAILRAQASGNTAEVERLGSELRRHVTENPGTPSVLHLGASPASDDPLDQLQRLADLHARGALSDAEFTFAKAKLLGQS